uniref:Uncharacterized protein n=1 Tax=Branchiostoma floridae TaxID=7739 RepID=C3XV73_BRAFL|eukprot:XP_002611990.1 hypothetical protein BRAFLDRAFT_91876 [Branchiostoma floridae]
MVTVWYNLRTEQDFNWFHMGVLRTFWLNTVLTFLGNITMVTVWYALQTGQDWYDIPAMVTPTNRMGTSLTNVHTPLEKRTLLDVQGDVPLGNGMCLPLLGNAPPEMVCLPGIGGVPPTPPPARGIGR